MISIVLPVYNTEKYLEDAVRSIMQQTAQDFELLALDDGSTDRSLPILRRLAAEDSRIIVHEFPHQGYAPLLNQGLAEARGEFLARMDADDICKPTRFEKQAALLRQRPELVAVGTDAIIIDSDGDLLKQLCVPTEHGDIDAAHLRGGGGTMPHPSLMMRTEAVRKIGGYRPEFEPAEDLDLLLRLAEVGGLANLPEPLLFYRVHDNMTSILRADKQWQMVERILVETWHRRALVGTPPTIPKPPRETVSPIAQFELRFQKAMHAGFFDTARKYSRRMLQRQPYLPYRWFQLFRAYYASFRRFRHQRLHLSS